jgi:hypothetical protein
MMYEGRNGFHETGKRKRKEQKKKIKEVRKRKGEDFSITSNFSFRLAKTGLSALSQGHK